MNRLMAPSPFNRSAPTASVVLAATDAEVVEHVRAHPGAIGYVAEGTPVEGVRILPVTQP